MKRAPRSRQRHDLYAKYHDYDSEISDLLGECGIKSNGGYKLQRHIREALSRKLGAETVTAQTSATLRGLEHKIPAGADKEFLKEAIDCFEVGARLRTY